jgi:hypothetical protein
MHLHISTTKSRASKLRGVDTWRGKLGRPSVRISLRDGKTEHHLVSCILNAEGRIPAIRLDHVLADARERLTTLAPAPRVKALMIRLEAQLLHKGFIAF